MAYIVVGNNRGPRGIPGPTGPGWLVGTLGPANEYTNPNTLPNGFFSVYSGANATAVGLPEGERGTVWSVSYGTAAEQYFFTANKHMWQRTKTGTDIWGAWGKIDSSQIQQAILSPAGVPLADDAPDGWSTVWGATNATDAGLPEAALGVVFTLRFGTAGYQKFITSTGHEWYRQRVSGNWRPWSNQIQQGILGTAPGQIGNPDDAPDGWTTIWSTSVATEIGLPEASLGGVFTLRFGNAGFQIFVTLNGKMWRRQRSTTWGAWAPIDSAGGGSSGSSGAVSGFKLVPLSLTLGQPSAPAPSTASYRVRNSWNAPITRWRMHITNRSVRHGDAVGTGMNISGIWVGLHAGSGSFASAPTQVATGVTIPDSGAEWISGWRTESIGDNQDMLFSYNYTSTSAPVLQVAGGWRSASLNGAEVAPAGLTQVNTAAFDIWIEAETYAGTPVIATVGDSLASGAQATFALRDSTLSIYCKSKRALPVHYAVSSDSMSSWIDNPNEYKVQRWSHLSRPDACLLAMGHNDAYGVDLTLAQMQANFNTAIPIIQSVISPNIYGSTITPRSAGSEAEHTVRHGYNDFLRQKVVTGELRDLFEFDQIITGGTDIIKVEFDADGIHFNTAGYQAQSDGILRAMTTPAPEAFKLDTDGVPYF